MKLNSAILRAAAIALSAAVATLPAISAEAVSGSAGASTGSAVHRGSGAKLPTVKIPAPRIRSLSVLPTSVDLRQWTVPIGDQGALNSCVGWAIGYGLMGWHAKKLGLAVNQFSPTYVYSQINHGSDSGSYPNEAVALIGSQGNDTMAHYTPGNDNWLTQPNAAQKRNASQYKALGGRTLFAWADQGDAASNALKAELAAGRPVAITIALREGFYLASPTNPVISDTTSDWSTSHEVLAVGYNSTGLIIQNSWGTAWGANGFATLTWAVVGQDVWQADTITGLEPRGTAMASTRANNGTWSNLTKVPNSGTMKSISSATAPNGATFNVAIDRTNQPYLTVRYVDGGWSGYAPIAARIGTNLSAAAIAVGPGTVSQVVSVSGGSLWYASRTATGSWSARVAVPGAPRGVSAVAATIDRVGALHLVMTTADGRLRYQYRSSAGRWSAVQDVTALGAPASTTAVAVAASPSGALHVSTISAGRQYYLVRRPTGWSRAIVVPASVASLKSVAVAGLSNGSAQFVTVSTAGVVYHQVRGSAANWSAVTNTNLYNVTAATIAGDGGDTAAPKGTTQFVSIR